MTDEEYSERIETGLPVKKKVTIHPSRQADVLGIVNSRYKEHLEYKPLFPNLELNRKPVVIADMEFGDSVEHVTDVIKAIDKAIGDVGQKVGEMLPDNQKSIYETTGTLRDAVISMRHTISKGNIQTFDAMVYPSIVALAEGAIGAALLRNIIQGRREKIGRRDFFRKMAKGAKAATVAWKNACINSGNSTSSR